jgi:Leucine Rich repeat
VSTRLKKVYLSGNAGIFGNETSTQQFARVLSRHEFVKKLVISYCGLGDEGIRIIADGYDGSTIIEVLDIGCNQITSVGFSDIMRLIESTRVKTISFWGNRVFDNENANQQLVAKLHKNTHVQTLNANWVGGGRELEELENTVNNICARNKCLANVNLLLVPTLQQQQQPNEKTSLMMFKTWHKAIAKFATVPNNAGASAIFKLFTARPQLLEKRLKRPTAAAAAVVSQE